MRFAQGFTLLSGVVALGVNASPHSEAFARRHVHARRDQVLGGKDHSLMRREDPEAKYDLFCSEKNRNKFEWNKVGMGNQLKLESNLFYDDGPCGSGPYGSFGDRSFIEAIQEQVEGYGTWNGCSVGSCAVAVDEESVCKKNSDNPMWLYFMFAIENLSDYLQLIKDGILHGADKADSMIGDMATDFSTQAEESDSSASTALTITAGVLSGLSAVLGAGGVMSQGIGAVSGALSGTVGVGTGILGAADADTGAVDVQAQLNRKTAMSKRLRGAQEKLEKYVDEWGTDLIEKPVKPQNDPYEREWYSQQPKSIPQILDNGDFAEKPKSDVKDNISNKIQEHFKAAAITYMWNQEKVFIATVSGKVLDTPACEVDLSKWGVTTWCNDDGVAHFFVKSKTGPGLGMKEIDPAPGVDKLEEYDIKQEVLIQTAIASQKDGGYLKEWNKDAVLAEDASEGIKVFNVPVCNLDKKWSNSHYRLGDYRDADIAIYQNIISCRSQKDDFGNEWPYQWKETWF